MRRLLAIGIIGAVLLMAQGRVDVVAAPTAPAPVGSGCTPYGQLRGSDAKAPVGGDVATVAQLCFHDLSVATLDRVPFSEMPGSPVNEMRLTRDASLHPLTSLGVPDSSAIDLRSRNGNWTHLFSGSFWRAPAITPNGEIQALDRGHAQFSVAQSLSYFAVVLPRFLARVKGTIFDIDFAPAQSAAFSVSEGTVAITRTTAIRLRDENRAIDGIRFTDIITAGGKSSITYKLPLGIEREFQNQSDAVRALTQQLQEAITSGDAQAVDDAVYNLQVVTGQSIVGFAKPQHPNGSQAATQTTTAAAGGHLSAGVIAGAAAAVAGIAAGIITSNSSPHAAATAPPTGPASGTVTLTAHAVTSPPPSPSPSPTHAPVAKPVVTPPPAPAVTPAAKPTLVPAPTPPPRPSGPAGPSGPPGKRS